MKKKSKRNNNNTIVIAGTGVVGRAGQTQGSWSDIKVHLAPRIKDVIDKHHQELRQGQEDQGEECILTGRSEEVVTKHSSFQSPARAENGPKFSR